MLSIWFFLRYWLASFLSSLSTRCSLPSLPLLLSYIHLIYGLPDINDPQTNYLCVVVFIYFKHGSKMIENSNMRHDDFDREIENWAKKMFHREIVLLINRKKSDEIEPPFRTRSTFLQIRSNSSWPTFGI